MRHRTALSVVAALSAAALAGIFHLQSQAVAGAEPSPAAGAACVSPQAPPPLPEWTDVEQFCREAERGQPWPGAVPPPPERFAEKSEEYGQTVQTFLRSLAYRQAPYGWQRDANWRLTGPYEGCPCPDSTGACAGVDRGPHPAVRIYYSPEIIDWLCRVRRGHEQLPDAFGLPAGAMIIKEMMKPDRVKLALVPGTDRLWIAPLPGKPDDYYDQSFDSWTVMIKAPQGSADGWYWAYFGRSGNGNPPLWDRSAFTTTPYPGSDGKPVTAPPGPEWCPTFWQYSVNNVQFPNYELGNYCTYCHASAQGESTFASLNNVLGREIRYAWKPAPRSLLDFDDHDHADLLPPATKSSCAPFPTPRPPGEALPGFRQAFGELAPTYAQVWDGRLPAQTYDHAVSRLGVPGALPAHGQFLTSDQCQGCHAAGGSGQLDLPHMVAEVDEQQIDLSPWAEWSASPMGLAGRDPIFHAQLELERNLARRQPGLATIRDCIDNTCLHCHGAAGARQYNVDTAGKGPAGDPCAAFLPPKAERAAADYDGALFTQAQVMAWRDENPAHARYGGLARDGITCSICHHIADRDLDPKNLPRTFTGNFRVGPPERIFGPFPNPASPDRVLPKPMEGALGITPEYGAQIARSEMCGTCHTVFLPVFDDGGKLAGTSYEQATYLEWLLSPFAGEAKAGGQTCQDCHMPAHFAGRSLSTGIANIQDTRYPEADFLLPAAEIDVAERPYNRHKLYGLNAFLNAFFQQYPLLLGYRQQNFMNPFVRSPLLAAREAVLEVARRETAEVRLDRVRMDGADLEAAVTVENLAGHNLPSGVGFRRLFVEFVVLDGNGQPLWASGRTNEIGQILEGTGDRPLPTETGKAGADGLPIQAHHQRITRPGQVQIYEEVTQNSTLELTSSFLHRYWELKDNRLRPKGYTPERIPAGPRREEYGEATRPGHGPHRHWWPKPEKPEPYVNPRFPGLARYTDTLGDPDYDVATRGPAGLPGTDSLIYRIRLTPEQRVQAQKIRVTLYSQSIPPHYLAERFRHAAQPGAERQAADRLHYMAGNLDTDAPADDGKPYLKGYKLRVGESAEQAVPK